MSRDHLIMMTLLMFVFVSGLFIGDHKHLSVEVVDCVSHQPKESR